MARTHQQVASSEESSPQADSESYEFRLPSKAQLREWKKESWQIIQARIAYQAEYESPIIITEKNKILLHGFRGGGNEVIKIIEPKYEYASRDSYPECPAILENDSVLGHSYYYRNEKYFTEHITYRAYIDIHDYQGIRSAVFGALNELRYQKDERLRNGELSISSSGISIRPAIRRMCETEVSAHLENQVVFHSQRFATAWNWKSFTPEFHYRAIAPNTHSWRNFSDPAEWAKQSAELAIGFAYECEAIADCPPEYIGNSYGIAASYLCNTYAAAELEPLSFVNNGRARDVLGLTSDRSKLPIADQALVLLELDKLGFSKAELTNVCRTFDKLEQVLDRGLRIKKFCSDVAALAKSGVNASEAYAACLKIATEVFSSNNANARPWWFAEKQSLVPVKNLSMAELISCAKITREAYQYSVRIFSALKESPVLCKALCEEQQVKLADKIARTFSIANYARGERVLKWCADIIAVGSSNGEKTFSDDNFNSLLRLLEQHRPSGFIVGALEDEQAVITIPGAYSLLAVSGSIEEHTFGDNITPLELASAARKLTSMPADKIDVALALHKDLKQGVRPSLGTMLRSDRLLEEKAELSSTNHKITPIDLLHFNDRLLAEVSAFNRDNIARTYFTFYARFFKNPLNPPPGFLKLVSEFTSLRENNYKFEFLALPSERAQLSRSNAINFANHQQLLASMLEATSYGLISTKQFQAIVNLLLAKDLVFDFAAHDKVMLAKRYQENLGWLAEFADHLLLQHKKLEVSSARHCKDAWLRGADISVLERYAVTSKRVLENSFRDHGISEDGRYLALLDYLCKSNEHENSPDFIGPRRATLFELIANEGYSIFKGNRFKVDESFLREVREEFQAARLENLREALDLISGLTKATKNSEITAALARLLAQSIFQTLNLDPSAKEIFSLSAPEVKQVKDAQPELEFLEAFHVDSLRMQEDLRERGASFVLSRILLEVKNCRTAIQAANRIYSRGVEVEASDLPKIGAGEFRYLDPNYLVQHPSLLVNFLPDKLFDSPWYLSVSTSESETIVTSDQIAFRFFELDRVVSGTAQVARSLMNGEPLPMTIISQEQTRLEYQDLRNAILDARLRSFGLLSLGMKAHFLHPVNPEKFRKFMIWTEMDRTSFKLEEATDSIIGYPAASAEELVIQLGMLLKLGIVSSDHPELQLCGPGRLPPNDVAVLGSTILLATERGVRYSPKSFSTGVHNHLTGYKVMTYDDLDARKPFPVDTVMPGRTDMLLRRAFSDAPNYQLVHSFLIRAIDGSEEGQKYFAPVANEFKELQRELLQRHGLIDVLSAPWINQRNGSISSTAEEHFEKAICPLTDAWFAACEQSEEQGEITGIIGETQSLLDWLQERFKLIQTQLWSFPEYQKAAKLLGIENLF